MSTIRSEPTPAVAAEPGVADPAPLGLAAFAMTTFVVSVFNADLLPADLDAVVLPLALFYGGIAQLLAGMWEFRNRNVFGATAFTSYGAFWLSYAAFVQFFHDELPPDTAHKAIGVFLLGWAIFTCYMLVASLRVSAAVALVFLLLAATFILLCTGEYMDSTSVLKWGGYVGLATAAAAAYASFAGVANATWGRVILPVVPLAPRPRSVDAR
ncbi:GPR1/FUN34/YaaH family transporter [Rhodococcus sp. X156]|uniref:acetate uptake transporter n=1 Tax=Rhodococcus sp. X156 TaxID=2499145 RepID=UPI000FD7C1A5|nr:GPR1/FUN34/YaaH family transporter [Rhodococcus sp. X156]